MLKIFSLLSFSFSFAKEKGKKLTKESKKKDRGRTERLAFKGWNEVQSEHFYKNAHTHSHFRDVGCKMMRVRSFLQKYSPTARIFGIYSSKKFKCKQ